MKSTIADKYVKKYGKRPYKLIGFFDHNLDDNEIEISDYNLDTAISLLYEEAGLPTPDWTCDNDKQLKNGLYVEFNKEEFFGYWDNDGDDEIEKMKFTSFSICIKQESNKNQIYVLEHFNKVVLKSNSEEISISKENLDWLLNIVDKGNYQYFEYENGNNVIYLNDK